MEYDPPMTDMKPWPVSNIPIKDIEVGERLRPLDPAEVGKKVESIRQVGLLQAITVSAHPAVSVPAGLTVSGLPVGVQLVGRYGADRRLLEIAAAIMALAG